MIVPWEMMTQQRLHRFYEAIDVDSQDMAATGETPSAREAKIMHKGLGE
jgi:hypothetical protein